MKFIHIGCWNYNSEQDNTKDVLISLNDYVSSNFGRYDFIVIAGDNYYPNIERYNTNTLKWIDVEQMLSNFKLFPENVEKYLLFGNNDINDKTVIDKDNKDKIVKIFKNDTGFNSYKNLTENIDQEKSCRLVDIEMLYTKGTKFRVYNGVMFRISGSNLVIMIDTSIYDKEIDNESVQCYKRILNTDYNEELSLEDLINDQNKAIMELIEQNVNKCSNLVIIGHHPICGMIICNERDTLQTNDKLICLFRNICCMIKKNDCYINISYLCSHIHSYENLEINIDNYLISQYICGCGGAELDKVNTSFENKEDNNYEVIIRHKDIYIKIKSIINKTFGYLVVDLPDGKEKINVDFIQVKKIE